MYMLAESSVRCTTYAGLQQDARKGVLFDDFPPVLQLQLKRFEYDFQRDIMVKVCKAFIANLPCLLCMTCFAAGFLCLEAFAILGNLHMSR